MGTSLLQDYYGHFSHRSEESQPPIIQCYAPTNEAEEKTKTEFYEKLQEAVRKGTASRDIVIVMGDFNAKIRSNKKGYELVVG